MTSVDEPPLLSTAVAFLGGYVVFAIARTAISVHVRRSGRGRAAAGAAPAVTTSLFNTLFFVEVFLIIAASFTLASALAVRFPMVPRAVAWLGCAVVLYVGRALARVVLPAGAAAVVGRFLRPVGRLVYLLLWPLFAAATAAGRALARLTRPGVDARAVSPAAEAAPAEDGSASGLAEDEQEMINGIFSIRETVAREVMVPRVEMVTADVRDPVPEVKRLVVAKGFSRIPVVDESPDKILGILHAKDIFKLEETGGELRSVLRKPVFVPETKKVNELLREFRAAKTQLAIVVDEYGGTAGLITLEDVLEEIVGEIQDEYDADVELLEKVGEREWLVAGRMDIGELNEELGLEIPESEFETVGGFISDLGGKVPAVGERLNFGVLAFEVTAADERRVKQVRLTFTGEGATGAGD